MLLIVSLKISYLGYNFSIVYMHYILELCFWLCMLSVTIGIL